MTTYLVPQDLPYNQAPYTFPNFVLVQFCNFHVCLSSRWSYMVLSVDILKKIQPRKDFVIEIMRTVYFSAGVCVVLSLWQWLHWTTVHYKHINIIYGLLLIKAYFSWKIICGLQEQSIFHDIFLMILLEGDGVVINHPSNPLKVER